jgi:hypothetical protein
MIHTIHTILTIGSYQQYIKKSHAQQCEIHIQFKFLLQNFTPKYKKTSMTIERITSLNNLDFQW